jgi:hypothetical protein
VTTSPAELDGLPVSLTAAPRAAARPRRTIFLSIAAYRDPELVPTITSARDNAQWPEDLRFGICWQHGPGEPRPDLFDDPRFRVVDVDWQDSRGACWARAKIMELWDGEDWYLQLDSHHRFVPQWDAKLVEQAEATGSPKPVLTAYAPAYSPEEPDHALQPAALRMEFDRFTEDGLVLFRPGEIPESSSSGAPLRSRFLSGHFLFASGSFVTEIPYDPDLYFIGEEITLAVRAYTHGYDLFHPGIPILWHEYTREHRTRHWDDHADSERVQITWSERDGPSRIRARQLLVDPDFGTFGLGGQRSLADYEAYAGINFLHRRAQDYTHQHFEPPNPPAGADWVFETNDHTVWITVPLAAMPPPEVTNFWYVGVYDDIGQEIMRADALPEEVAQLLEVAGDGVTFVRQFESTARPVAWGVRPHTDPEGWGDALQGPLVAIGASSQQCFWSGGDAAHSSVAVALEAGDVECGSRFPTLLPGVQWRAVEGGFEVAHPGQSSPITINHTGVLLLELANGEYSVDDIIDVVQSSFDLAEPPREMVMEFLAEAELSGLVQTVTNHEREHSERRIRA